MKGKNNPFNIRNNRRNKWLGQIGSRNGFCSFCSLDHGIRAAAYILMISYRRFGICTIEGIINRFAPSSENDTWNYIRYVCSVTGFLKSTQLFETADYVKVLFAMSSMEGNPLSLEQIRHTLNLFRITPLKIA